MSHRQCTSKNVIIGTTTIAVMVLLVLSSLAMTAQALPIRPTPEDPTEEPTEEPEAPKVAPMPDLGALELHVRFPETWPWQQSAWDQLWTVVEWKDAKGNWRTVAGWQGTLDEVTRDADDAVTSKKTWWVGKPNLGRGPFRWRVYSSQNGTLLATSETFTLPQSTHETVQVEISLP